MKTKGSVFPDVRQYSHTAAEAVSQQFSKDHLFEDTTLTQLGLSGRQLLQTHISRKVCFELMQLLACCCSYQSENEIVLIKLNKDTAVSKIFRPRDKFYFQSCDDFNSVYALVSDSEENWSIFSIHAKDKVIRSMKANGVVTNHNWLQQLNPKYRKYEIMDSSGAYMKLKPLNSSSLEVVSILVEELFSILVRDPLSLLRWCFETCVVIESFGINQMKTSSIRVNQSQALMRKSGYSVGADEDSSRETVISILDQPSEKPKQKLPNRIPTEEDPFNTKLVIERPKPKQYPGFIANSVSLSDKNTMDIKNQLTLGRPDNPLVLGNPQHLRNHVMNQGVAPGVYLPAIRKGDPPQYLAAGYPQYVAVPSGPLPQLAPQRNPKTDTRNKKSRPPSTRRRRRETSYDSDDQSREDSRDSSQTYSRESSSEDRRTTSEATRPPQTGRPRTQGGVKSQAPPLDGELAALKDRYAKVSPTEVANRAMKENLQMHLEGLKQRYNVVGLEFNTLGQRAALGAVPPVYEPSQTAEPQVQVITPKEDSSDGYDPEDEYLKELKQYEEKKAVVRAKNMLIRENNLRKKQKERDRMEQREKVLTKLLENVNVMPPLPNVPQLYSIGGNQQFPLDFNMKVQIMQDQEKLAKKNQRKLEIENTIVYPLNNLYGRLDDLRNQLKKMKTDRDKRREEIKDADVENFDEYEREVYDTKKESLE